MVTGSFEASSSRTGMRLRIDSPKSPRRTLPIQIPYWSGIGLVEVVPRADRRDRGGVVLLARQRQRRVAGQELLEAEDQHGDDEQASARARPARRATKSRSVIPSGS